MPSRPMTRLDAPMATIRHTQRCTALGAESISFSVITFNDPALISVSPSPTLSFAPPCSVA